MRETHVWRDNDRDYWETNSAADEITLIRW
nr:MAG TPA: hypothetical protein [Herelleviridae sp.]